VGCSRVEPSLNIMEKKQEYHDFGTFQVITETAYGHTYPITVQKMSPAETICYSFRYNEFTSWDMFTGEKRETKYPKGLSIWELEPWFPGIKDAWAKLFAK